MVRIVFLDRATIAPHIKIARPDFEHTWQEFQKTTPDQILEHAQDAEIIITNKVPIQAKTIALLPKLRMVSVIATGFDHIDIHAARARGILVSNVPNYAENSVAEHVFALILALARNVVAYRADVIDGAWQRSGQFSFFDHEVRGLYGARLGLIGSGNLGQAVAKHARHFGMEVCFAARKGAQNQEDRPAFEDVLKSSDILSIHCPLNSTTRDLISGREFEMMEQRPILINTARGGVVNEEALVLALERGLVRGVGIDVLTKEPPDPDHPLMRVAAYPNVILTPHMAWASHEAMQALVNRCIANVEDFIKGTPKNRVS